MPAVTFSPRIYYFNPLLAGDLSQWPAHFDRCAAMGFDHLLMRAPCAENDHRRFHTACSRDTSMIDGLALVASECAARKLHLILAVEIDRIAHGHKLVAAHPDWFCTAISNDGGLPDPRSVTDNAGHVPARFDRQDAAEGLFSYWNELLAAWIAAGVAGIQLQSVAGLPASFCERLIESLQTGAGNRTTAVKFLAWTPGCTPLQLQQLEGRGFDAVFSSVAWWDYRAHWIVEEHARLSRVGTPIAFPENPFGTPAATVHNTVPAATEMLRQEHERALWTAVTCGSGLLVPMGFEYGIGAMPGSQDAEEFSRACNAAPFDLTAEIHAANALAARLAGDCALKILSDPHSAATILLRTRRNKLAAEGALLAFVNPASDKAASIDPVALPVFLARSGGLQPAGRLHPADAAQHDGPIELAASEIQLFAAQSAAPISAYAIFVKRNAGKAARAPRIAIEAVTPTVDEGRFPVKRIVGESVHISADLFIDGHDKIDAALLWRTADQRDWQRIAMTPVGNDRWAAALPLTRLGRYLFAVEAWQDSFGTYQDELKKKTDAGLNVDLELREGLLLVAAAEKSAMANQLDAVVKTLKEIRTTFAAGGKKITDEIADTAACTTALLSPQIASAMKVADMRPFAARTETLFAIESERPAARFASWYELFPRSQSGDPLRHGTFADVTERLPAIRAMGFDTLYFPPIHPIGKKNRKGRNNSLSADNDDPGSPYAIGSGEGGHDKIHPELGTLADFRKLRAAAAEQGLEIALDFAVQCAPDHPWLAQHPDWFSWRPDGSIRYAENPPKKYQDIVNVDFYADGAVPDLWIALRDIVLQWAQEGVRVFRVDNPHTKPLPFWEWLIADIRSRLPDTIFLAEAFTRPKPMHRLAKIGFSQSYTYFTWRHTKAEFIDYLTELNAAPASDYFRPHFFVNTPDINPYFLQHSGRPGFVIRAALAATLSGLWGMYSGFELCEAQPVPGKEEYLDSEKYQLRAWDWQRPGNIIREITLLNRLRAANPALQTHLGIQFHTASDDHILYFSKSTAAIDADEGRFGDNTILVAINLDPFAAHEAEIELPLWKFGLTDSGSIHVEDLVHDIDWDWYGKWQHIRLDPFTLPFAIWRIRAQGN